MAHDRIARFANQGAHDPGAHNLRIFKRQVLDHGTFNKSKQSRKVAGGLVNDQILDGMVLAVKRSVENMHAIANGFKIQALSIDIGRQLIITQQRVSEIMSDFLEFSKSRNFNLVRDCHMARRSPHRILTDDHANSITIVQGIPAKGIVHKHRLHRTRPLSYKLTFYVNERGNRRSPLPLSCHRRDRNRNK